MRSSPGIRGSHDEIGDVMSSVVPYDQEADAGELRRLGPDRSSERQWGGAPRPSGKRLGDELRDAGVLSTSALEDSARLARDEGVPMGRVLVSGGDISRLELYGALARSWGLELVDVRYFDTDKSLSDPVSARVMLEGGWLPLWRETLGGAQGALVATCQAPTQVRADEICRFLGVEVLRFVATTDWDIEQGVLSAKSESIVASAVEGPAALDPELSASSVWAPWQRVVAIGTIVAVAGCLAYNWSVTLFALLVVANLLFAAGVAFKFSSGLVGLFANLRRGHLADRQRTADRDLPTFTILVPAYREANVVAKVIEHVSALDYPRHKLQVLLLLEADDTETLEVAKAAQPPDYLRIVLIPPGGPQTKPRACNVGLQFATGDFLVIYDAEDRPDPDQLREVVAEFAVADDDVVCLQARLNYFNASENLLTRMFSLEYTTWFDTMLPGLDALRLPIPLGGTSNHFRTQGLRRLGAWDPYNVTEDADVGIRAATLGERIGICDSTTWEEGCSRTGSWIKQRTRWLKGYMATTLVHTRHPFRTLRRLGLRGTLGFLGLIAGTPATFLAAPVVWGLWLYAFLGGNLGVHLSESQQVVALWILIGGNAAMIFLSAAAAARRRSWWLMPFTLLNPLYWVLHSIAAWRALWQLVFSPSVWEKTPHGLQHGPGDD